jgi:hypothetical protein
VVAEVEAEAEAEVAGVWKTQVVGLESAGGEGGGKGLEAEGGGALPLSLSLCCRCLWRRRRLFLSHPAVPLEGPMAAAGLNVWGCADTLALETRIRPLLC